MSQYKLEVLNKKIDGGIVYVDFKGVDVNSEEVVCKYIDHNMTTHQAQKLEQRLASILMINLENKSLEDFDEETSSTDMIEEGFIEIIRSDK